MLMEEQLQHSMATSEEDAEFEEDDELAPDGLSETAHAYAANNQLQNGMLEDQSEMDEEEGSGEDDEDVLSDEDAEGEDDLGDQVGDIGIEDEEVEDQGDEDEDEEDEDGEGVGAVKIQPGLRDDDEDVLSGTDDEDSSADVEEDDDESKDSTDAEVEIEWVPAAEEDEELANPNRCM